MGNEWQFTGSCREKEPFEIRGVNVWDQGWQVVPGQEAHVHDPVYGQGYVFHVYNIQDGEEKIEFAAGQFTSGEWGFFTKE